jgi:hypothetical protein
MTLSIRALGIAGFLGVFAFAVSIASSGASDTNQALLVHARTANPAPPQPVATEAPEPPLSNFAIPRRASEGRDPFFPNSSRVYGTDSVAKSTNSTNAPTIAADLTLKGISGSTEQPLAIINTTTFTTGEANEVILKGGRRVRIVCVEINMSAGTALVQVGAERRELRLAPLK